MFEEEQEPEFEIFSALLFNSLKAVTFMFFIISSHLIAGVILLRSVTVTLL